MTTETITPDLVAQLRRNIADLLDENTELKAANARLGEAAKALIAEKGDLQKQLAAKSGLGVQQNQPGAFHDLQRQADLPKE